jgi:HD superfamily phosphohydrolase YqeK
MGTAAVASVSLLHILALHAIDLSEHTSSGEATVHPLIEAAGRNGDLPEWAEFSKSRRRHVERVAKLMGEWARDLGLSGEEKRRWRAAGRLHDAVKDAKTSKLKKLVGEDRWPDSLLHAPAAAILLERDGVDDEEFLLAVRFHSVGHRDFGDLGTYLYLADFLEPGRKARARERAALRAGMPGSRDDVLPHVIRRRIGTLLGAGQAILPEAVDYWNRVNGA